MRNPTLHTPMCCFLSRLSFVDFCYTSVIAPKLLRLLLVEDRAVSLNGRMIQFFFGCTCAITQSFLLPAMAYDCLMAVCKPPLYTVAMSPKLCAALVAGTYLWGGVCSSTLTHFLLQLTYCRSGVIDHFCCEYSSILAAACSDTTLSQLACFVIFATVTRLPSKGGLRKAFPTCALHLTTISFCRGVILLLYCVLNAQGSLLLVKVATVFHSMMVPMLNPSSRASETKT
ncbi:olfactory receptor 1165-like [Ctenodactylus gundi]